MTNVTFSADKCYNTSMEIPWRCRICNQENMVDFENLSEWPVDKLIKARGFRCENCGMMEAVGYSTVSLENKIRKLLGVMPEHPKFAFMFKATLRKAKGVNLRGDRIWRART